IGGKSQAPAKFKYRRIIQFIQYGIIKERGKTLLY
ncbi:unnamed protein product, partial [marine sediment metagenome]